MQKVEGKDFLLEPCVVVEASNVTGAFVAECGVKRHHLNGRRRPQEPSGQASAEEAPQAL
jgi:hypothetical protein